jgi:hypothetical protein
MLNAGLPNLGLLSKMVSRGRFADLQNALRALITLWILISPWILVHASMPVVIYPAALINLFVVGVVLLVVSVAPPTAGKPADAYVSMVGGSWLIVSPWVLGYADSAVLTCNSAVVGILVLLLSGWIQRTDPQQHLRAR